MPKDESVEKKILAEQRSLAGTKGKKRKIYNFRKKRQAAQDDYKDIMRLCREKIERAKAQIRINLATPIKGYNFFFLQID